MPKTYDDSTAKRLMRDTWPIYKKDWLGAHGDWLRLLPFPIRGGPIKPYLHTPGGALISSPDGMFGAFGENFVDVLILEHCSSKQNFFDKRSRYGASHSSIILGLPSAWCNDWIARVHGGHGGSWKYFGELVQQSGKVPSPPWLGRCVHPNAKRSEYDWKFPVRSLICVYFLNPTDKVALEKSGLVLPRHEYVTTHSRIAQITAQSFRKWISAAMDTNQFL